MVLSILLQECEYEMPVLDSPCPQTEQQQKWTVDVDALNAAKKEQEHLTAAAIASAKAYALKMAAACEDLQQSINETLEQEAIADKARAEKDAFEALLGFEKAYANTPCKSSRLDTLWAVCDVYDELAADAPSPQVIVPRVLVLCLLCVVATSCLTHYSFV